MTPLQKKHLEFMRGTEPVGINGLTKAEEDATASVRGLINNKSPKRTWVGLTDEESEDIWNRYCDEMGEASINDAPDIARAIESALRSKNT